MRIGTKIATFLTTAVIMLFGSNLAWADSNNSIVAKSASEFAKDVGFDKNAIAALEEHEKGLTPHYIQCGETLCNLNTHFCYKEAPSWTSGQGGSISFCRCVKGKPPVDNSNGFYDNNETGTGASTKVTRTIVTSNCTEFKGQRGQVLKEYIEASDSERRKYRVHMGKDTTVQYGEENFRGCEVLPVKLYKHKKCFFCPMIGVLYNATATSTDASLRKIAPAFAALLMIGFGLWILILCLSHISSLTKQDAPKFIGSLLKQSYKVLIVFVLLLYPQNIFDYMITPVINAGLAFGKNMITTEANNVFSGLDYENGKYVRQAIGNPGGKHYNNNTYDKLEKYIVAVQREVAFMQATGTSLLCVGSDMLLTLEVWKDDFSIGFLMVIQGIILTVFGFLMSISFVFYLMDGIIQLGVAGALLPFSLASWPFKPTAKWSKVCVQMILNSAFLFMFMGLVISACMHLINAALGSPQTIATQQQNESLSEEEVNFGGLYEIANVINQQKIDKLKELTDISGANVLILLFSSIFALNFIKQAPDLANKFASGGTGKLIAPSFATITSSFAKSAALKATTDIRESASEHIKNGAEKAGGLVWRGAKGVAKLPKKAATKMYNWVRGENKKANDDSSYIRTSAENKKNASSKSIKSSAQLSEISKNKNSTLEERTSKPQNDGYNYKEQDPQDNNEQQGYNFNTEQNNDVEQRVKNAKHKPQTKTNRKSAGGSGKNRKKHKSRKKSYKR